MEEKRITERESLEIITSMIARTKERYVGDGNILLMWGYVTVAVAALVWVMLFTTRNPAWNWLWFLNGIIGGIATPIMARKQEARFGVKSYSDKVTSHIWTAVGITAVVATLCCLAFQMVLNVCCWRTMLVFALVVVAFAELAQGIVVKEASLVAGGAIGLCAGLVTVCCIAGEVPLAIDWFMPMFIVAFVCMMIIPGHIINHKSKSQQ